MKGELSHYSMMAFGQYLTEMAVRLEAELYSTCSNDALKIQTVKRKYGQLEATKVILKAFTELYEKDLSWFKKEYLNESDDTESDGEKDSTVSGQE